MHVTITTNKKMKSSHTFGITIVLLIVIAAMLILSAFNQPVVDAQVLMNSSLRAQVTSTPVAEDNSVIGSTDGIVVMGILIVLIAVTPLFFRRKKK